MALLDLLEGDLLMSICDTLLADHPHIVVALFTSCKRLSTVRGIPLSLLCLDFTAKRWKPLAQQHKRFSVRSCAFSGPTVLDSTLDSLRHQHSSLQIIIFSGCNQLTDLTALAVCAFLRTAKFTRCRNLRDFSQLQHCESLQVLHCIECRRLDQDSLSPLSNCRVLHEIDLSRSTSIKTVSIPSSSIRILCMNGLKEMTDLCPLVTGCLHLTQLDVSNCLKLSHIHPLARLRFLKHLSLSGCKAVTDVSVLEPCEALEKLNLDGTGITNITQLAACQELSYLNLSNCSRVVDIYYLSVMTALRNLKLRNAHRIAEISAISSGQFEEIDLSGCRAIPDLTPCAANKELRVLNVSGCGNIDTIDPLAQCTHLHGLDLSGLRRMSDIQALASLSELLTLNLTGCLGISDISPLQGMGVVNLDLSDCIQVTDVSCLLDCASLLKLSLFGSGAWGSTLAQESASLRELIDKDGHELECGKSYGSKRRRKFSQDKDDLGFLFAAHRESVEFYTYEGE